ncbi:uncharacterized protein LOC114477167 [Gouania willdenowi]|uniref:uncharacterized protein LOC114477167 n=1 Tax=Gouania willdenowi TaxID=441366 RepID=UPI001055EF91|nr:uncharacterized protein LOC114477167 [Gouania willdenowi]
MALRETLLCLCSFAVVTLSAAQDGLSSNCNSQDEPFDRLSADLKMIVESGKMPPDWSLERTATLLLHMRNLTGILRYRLRECVGAEPKQCPEAEVPENGGLACVTFANRRYCKPMCNHGYDFGFLRRSRPFDECSHQTSYKWNSQYVGGNKLAVCNEAPVQVGGASTAYFAKDQDCLAVRSSSEFTNTILEDFKNEIKKDNIEGEPQGACLICG